MAKLTENAQWGDIYQLESTDIAKGGADGKANLQAKQLANRTAFLKNKIDELLVAAPDALNTFAELAAAIRDDADFGQNIINQLANKEPKFSKNDGFNRPFGIDEETVAEGNHTHTPTQVGLGNIPNRLENSPNLLSLSAVASNKAVNTVYKLAQGADAKFPKWYDKDSGNARDGQDLLRVICAGIVRVDGSRQDWWGKDRVGTHPFSCKKLRDYGLYEITHNFQNITYGLAGSGLHISTSPTLSKVTMVKKSSNSCEVVTSNDSSADPSAFSFIIFDLQ